MRLKATLMDAKQMRRVIIRMANEIIEGNRGADRLTLVGIGKRGVPLAKDIAAVIETVEQVKVPVVEWIDFEIGQAVENEISADAIGGISVVIVTDVLHTGYTARAAIDAVVKTRRPEKVRLAVMVDRGGKELPLSPDYVGVKAELTKNDIVSVSVMQTDGENRVDVYGANE